MAWKTVIKSSPDAKAEPTDELKTAVYFAAEKLVRCKGRYHSEQNYRALAALLGVNAPHISPWRVRDISLPILVENSEPLALLLRWQGDKTPSVGWYLGNDLFQHADGTREDMIGWKGVPRCIEWMVIPV
ncbi:particle associated protein [Yersinia phage fHe-Yen8-01]|nr:particle associated protein [Yersinia phage fHe-Yen8-01]